MAGNLVHHQLDIKLSMATGKAKCKGCRQKIVKGEREVIHHTSYMYHPLDEHYHPECLLIIYNDYITQIVQMIR